MKRLFAQRQRKLTFEQRQEIINKHFKKGISQIQLAKDYKVCRQMIQRYCSKNGNSPLLRNYNLDTEKIIDLYVNKKMSVLRIATIIGVNRTPIDRRLRLAGIIKRRKSLRKYFEKIIPNYHLRLKIWAAKVIDRDGLMCKLCQIENSYENRLEAHHIKPIKEIENPDSIFDIKNGITLCRKCHLKTFYKEKDFEKTFLKLITTV